MNENIYAYTEPSAAPYPAYVSINRRDADHVSITVRSAGATEASEIALPIDVFSRLRVDLSPYDPADFDPFLFEMGEEVEISVSGERGTVVARTECEGFTSYLLHYKAANGCAVSGWFYCDHLEPVYANECEACDDLSTDAEIPMGFDPAPAGDAVTEWTKAEWTPVQPVEAQ